MKLSFSPFTDVPRWVWLMFATIWSPALILVFLFALVPLYICAFTLVNIVNIVRAARYRPRRVLLLFRAILLHLHFIAIRLPQMTRIAVYYYLVAPRDGVRKSLPYAYHRRADGGGGDEYLLADVYFHTAAAAAAAAASPDSSYGTSLSEEKSGQRHVRGMSPVIIFVYGGGWGSGSRWYYACFAAALRAATGAVVVVPEYSTYPKGSMSKMVSDIHAAVAWTKSAIARFGGDPSRITLVGHSAGAHLVALYLVRRAMFLARKGENTPDPSCMPLSTTPGSNEPIPLLTLWPCFHYRYPTPPPTVDLDDLFRAVHINQRGSSADESGAVLLSGVYDLLDHYEFESRRGVEEVSAMRPATLNEWASSSPLRLLSCLDASQRHAVLAMMPPMTVFHAETDHTVDLSQSARFCAVCDIPFQHGGEGHSGIISGVDHSGMVLDVPYVGPTVDVTHPTLRAIRAAMGLVATRNT